MVTTRHIGGDRKRALRHLHELIAAIDRRLPQVERAGEAAIAAEAAALRKKAQERIKELEGASPT
jgi:hypothetical protein